MIEALKIEFHVGETRFRQRIRLVFEKGSDGVRGWTLYKDAAGQRDDNCIISGIDATTIRNMAEAVSSIEHQKCKL